MLVLRLPSRPASVSLRRSDSSSADELSAAANFQRPRASSQASKAISGRCRHSPVDWVVPPALNRKSISPLLTAAGWEKLLISAADLRKCPDCLRSSLIAFDAWLLALGR
jgi:hypothetical protein